MQSPVSKRPQTLPVNESPTKRMSTYISLARARFNSPKPERITLRENPYGTERKALVETKRVNLPPSARFAARRVSSPSKLPSSSGPRSHLPYASINSPIAAVKKPTVTVRMSPWKTRRPHPLNTADKKLVTAPQSLIPPASPSSPPATPSVSSQIITAVLSSTPIPSQAAGAAFMTQATQPAATHRADQSAPQAFSTPTKPQPSTAVASTSSQASPTVTPTTVKERKTVTVTHTRARRVVNSPTSADSSSAAVSSAATTPRQPAKDVEMDDGEFNPYVFIKNLPALASIPSEQRPRVAPLKSLTPHPICLALDLDETLVHCSVQPIPNPDVVFTVNFNSVDYEVYVRTRPYMTQFLETVSQWFEIVVFTASQKVYADKLLTLLDPKRQWISHRLFRDSCLPVDGNYLKDLTVLGRDMRKVALVDNSVQAFGFHLNNGIPIESWFEDSQDSELLKLLPFLNKLKDAQDVRPLIQEAFRIEEFVKSL